MFKTNRRSMLKSSAAFSTIVMMPQLARAQASSAFVPPSHTPEDLKGVLTPLGGERAGNAAGTIPPWTGGYGTLPPGFKPGDAREIPFANEKPLFSITPSNYQQYKDNLCVGQIDFFERYPDFRMDIYPTHRTAIAPQYVYDYTYKNTATAQLSTDGNSISGAYGGTPFPIPANGHQVMWNHLLAWRGYAITDVGVSYLVSSTGQIVEESSEIVTVQLPYFKENGEAEFDGYYGLTVIDPTAPPYQAGGAILQLMPINPLIKQQQTYLYLTGQRRVREAPELQYDTPDAFGGGIINWDEYQLFSGALDQYDCALIGRKEVYVPYNMNKAWASDPEAQYLPKFLNPDISRWELHRCWVVEMTVKAGKRNVAARRVIYIDDDTWNALLVDVFDAGGSHWKFQHAIPAILPEIPCLIGSNYSILYNLHVGAYITVNGVIGKNYNQAYIPVSEIPRSFFTPGQLAANAGGF